MNLATKIIVFALCVLWIVAQPAPSMYRMLDSDSVYFPDQADYIKLSTKCPPNTIFWPGTQRCYKEGEQGPCNFGRVLAFNGRLLKPYCKDDIP